MINILMPDMTGNERQYLNECIDEGWVSSQGRFVTKFEELVLRDLKEHHCLSTSNGTVALHLALVALGIGAGDEVIVPEITFGATLNAIAYVGATPVIVDIDPADWNMSRARLNLARSERTKAVLPVALFGNPVGMAEVASWAKENNLVTIVDAAEAVGAKVNGVDIGAIGDAVTYSYFGNKTITTGEGGAVVFKDESIAKQARVLRDHGMTPGRRYHHEVIGFNYRMTNIQAALGVAQYERLDQILDKRKKIINSYKQKLQDVPVEFQRVNNCCDSSNWVCSVLLPIERRKAVEEALKMKGIEYRRCFEPMSRQPAFSNKRIASDLKNSNMVYESLLMLPTHSHLTDGQINMVCNTIKSALISK